MFQFLVLLLTSSSVLGARIDCSKQEYDRCVSIADPLVKEVHLVFPDNMDDIDLVCRTWNRFVDCLKLYTEHCFTDQQRRQFNRAVESPIESVHQMCMQSNYQKEYLQYAPCIKNTITQNIHCGPQYNLLVDQVSQGDIISKSTLCCSHDRFKQCIQKETRRLCDRGIPDGPAARFATQIIDKALSFLQDQCLNYIPNSGDCHTLTTDTFSNDPLMISTSPSEVYPWSTIQQEVAAKELNPQPKVTPPRTISSTPWLPTVSTPVHVTPNSPISATTELLGRRTRPSSYGRSNGWSETAQVGGNTVQMYPEQTISSSTAPPVRSDWSTAPTWNLVQNQNNQINPSSTIETNRERNGGFSWNPGSVSTETTWYPAAGNQLNNEVDEPNQLGLKKPRNGSPRLFRADLALIFVFGLVSLFNF